MADPPNPPRQAEKPNPPVAPRKLVRDRNYKPGPTAKRELQGVEPPKEET